MKDISSIIGKKYRSPKTGEEYGLFRKPAGKLPSGFSAARFGTPFAEDGSGNLFTEDANQQICFWDHETDVVTAIAASWDEFVRGCTEPKEIRLEDGQVKSAWINPELAKKYGIKAPKDGWIKKET